MLDIFKMKLPKIKKPRLPKLPKIELTAMARSRLKLTIVGTIICTLALSLPTYVILKATSFGMFDLTQPWIAWAGVIATLGGIIGYYVNRETARPSLLINTGDNFGQKILPGEDESDPENIPL